MKKLLIITTLVIISNCLMAQKNWDSIAQDAAYFNKVQISSKCKEIKKNFLFSIILRYGDIDDLKETRSWAIMFYCMQITEDEYIDLLSGEVDLIRIKKLTNKNQ